MLQRPLIPLDGSPSAEEALEALVPAFRRSSSRPILLGLLADPTYPETLARRLAARGLAARARSRPDPPDRAILTVAEEEDASLIVLVTDDPGAGAARRLAARTARSVASLPADRLRERPEPEKILAAMAGDWDGLRRGVGELARAFRARVLAAGPDPAELARAAEDMMDLRIPVETQRLPAASAPAVLELGRERAADLLAVGSAWASEVLGRTDLPVVVVRNP